LKGRNLAVAENAGDRLSPSFNQGVGSPLDAARSSDDTTTLFNGKSRKLLMPSPGGSQSRPERPEKKDVAMTLRRGNIFLFVQPDCSGSQAMHADKPHQIWIEQCEAARTIRERFGLEGAFDVLQVLLRESQK
jgi:hypothetical protein